MVSGLKQDFAYMETEIKKTMELERIRRTLNLTLFAWLHRRALVSIFLSVYLTSKNRIFKADYLRAIVTFVHLENIFRKSAHFGNFRRLFVVFQKQAGITQQFLRINFFHLHAYLASMV